MPATRNLGNLGAALVLGALAALAGAGARATETHWPLPPAELERLLGHEPFEIREVKGGVGGVMGVRKLSLHFPGSGQDLTVKWKRAPDGDADGWNNTPRKEIAAYEIQKWFLDPEDFVVPTVVPRCIPFEVYEPVEENATPSMEGSSCAMGVLVIWMENVGIDDEIYEPERFRTDPRYAYHLANMNLLTYLIEHEDGRRNNFLTADDKSDRRIFSIDNGVSFGAKLKNWFVWNWNKIRVPALRRQTIERLRRVGPEQVAALGVVAELAVGDDGVYRPVASSANPDPKHGSRRREGWIQLGLTQHEIEHLQERIDGLLERVEEGRQPVY